MTTPTWTPPPWADLDLIVARTLTVMRMRTDDPDADRMRPYAEAAAQAIQRFLDCPPGQEPATPTPDLTEAAAQVTQRLFRGAKDAPFGVIGGWSENDLGPTRIPSDVLQGVYSLINPYRQRWGLA